MNDRVPTVVDGFSKELDMAEVKHPIIGVVDDDEDVRTSIQFLLEIAGHDVETFASADDLLKAEPRRLACLVLDHHMPNTTGLELSERLRADGVPIPILLITGSTSPTIVARAAELGIDRVLEKPFDEEDLLGFVNYAARDSTRVQVSGDIRVYRHAPPRRGGL